MEVNNADLWTLLLSCIRYSMGRRSYITAYAPEMVKRYHQVLSADQLRQIKEEISHELGREFASPGHLGYKIDIENWQELANWCQLELMRRGNSSDK